jgi:hypothetical protein
LPFAISAPELDGFSKTTCLLHREKLLLQPHLLLQTQPLVLMVLRALLAATV